MTIEMVLVTLLYISTMYVTAIGILHAINLLITQEPKKLLELQILIACIGWASIIAMGY